MILVDQSLHTSGDHYMTPTQTSCTKLYPGNPSKNYHTFCIKFDFSQNGSDLMTSVFSIGFLNAPSFSLDLLKVVGKKDKHIPPNGGEQS